MIAARWICACLLLGAAPAMASVGCPALLVAVRAGLEGAAAGLAKGDCVHAWRRGDEIFELRDPLDLEQIDLDQLPRGGVELEISNSRGRRWVAVGTGALGVQTLPELPEDQRQALLAWGEAPGVPPPRTTGTARAVVAVASWQSSQLLGSAPAAAETLLQQTLAATPAGTDPQAHALLHYARCNQGMLGWKVELTLPACVAAMDAMEQAGLSVARLHAWRHYASILRIAGRLDDSGRELENLLAALAQQVPDSTLHAQALLERAMYLRTRERLDDALAAAGRARAAFDKARSPEQYRMLLDSSSGLIQRARGEHDEAERLLRQAVATAERLVPDTLVLARLLNNLALVQWDRMDMAHAQASLERSLAIKRRRDATPLDLAATLGNLALIAFPLGQLDAVERYAGESLAIHRALPPGTHLAGILVTMARVHEERGDYAAAHRAYDEALELYREHAPGSSLEGWAHHFRAGLLITQGRHAEALPSARIAERLQRSISPGGRDLSFALERLGDIELALGEHAAALTHFDESIGLRRRQSPDSQSLANVLHGAGLASAALGQPDSARERHCEAVSVLERQRLHWTQDRDDLQRLGARNVEIYRACALAWLQQGDATAAFDTLEQARARLLLDSMARHRSELQATLPADLAADWRALQRAEPAALAPGLDAFERRAAREAPAQSALLLTRPRTWAELRKQLAGDSAILAHLVDRERLYIVVARPRDEVPHFVAVNVDRSALLDHVQRLAALARKPDSRLETLRREARWLHARLIEPALSLLADSPRLLWVPDADLSLLPLAVLVDAQGRYLIESHALRQSTSLTAAMLARRHPGSPVASELLAVADPLLAAHQDAPAASWRGASIEGLAPLPGAVAEARSIARLYPGTSTLLRGTEATEKRVRTLAPGARRLHFAVHGLVDPLRPLDSALVLAAGDGSDRDDGLLRAVDLLTGPPLVADLVAVAACDLGSGRVDAAEGLIGLRHALRAAGAREVVSSLWPVGDRSGARLMTDFHAQLRQDAASDRALQQAQLSMLRTGTGGGDAVRGVGGVAPQRGRAGPLHPFHWAGFVLDGTLE